MKRLKGYRGLVIVSVAFVAMMGLSVFEGTRLYRRTVDYARQDLKARAELAALVLEEPLRTQDFKAIREFADDCQAKDIRFRVFHRNGVVFGSDGDVSDLAEEHACGEYRISLGINGRKILLPFLGSLALAGLAFLVGIAGMLFVFYAFYRQRAKLAEMKRLEKERYDFVTRFTHELKTPLTGIIAAADLMEGDRLADMIKSSAHRLDQLAQDLIDVYWGSGISGLRGAEPANQDKIRGSEPANQDRVRGAEPANQDWVTADRRKFAGC